MVAEYTVPTVILGCSQLVTLAGPQRPRTGNDMRDLAIIHDGAMLIEEGRIKRVGPRSEIEPLIEKGCAVVDAGNRVVLPGFVDAHTHPVFAGNRADEFEQRAGGASYSDIAAAGGGIRSTVRQTRAATEDALLDSTTKYVQWFLRNGTTTIEAKSGYGLTPDQEYKLLRVIGRIKPLRCVPTFLGAHEIPVEFRGRAHDYATVVDWACACTPTSFRSLAPQNWPPSLAQPLRIIWNTLMNRESQRCMPPECNRCCCRARSTRSARPAIQTHAA